jgi:AraC-like DNA-binding protein
VRQVARPQPEQFHSPSISIVRSGAFGIRSEHGPQLLASGFVLLGNPGQAYEAFHEHEGGDRCLVFEFTDASEPLIDGLRRGAGRRPFALNVLPPHARVEALRLLAEESLAAGAPHFGLEELSIALLHAVLQQAGRGLERPPPKARGDVRLRERIHAAIEVLERCGHEELHLGDVAESVGLSAFHFLRLFKQQTGISPYQYLVRLRIRRAMQLLRGSSRPVTDIAFLVGFGDLSNFNHMFKREVGCSPRRFRNACSSDTYLVRA